jgi:chemotaxis protein methyltransferase CheR
VPPPRGAQQGARELFDRALELARTSQPDRALELLDAVIAREESFVKAHTLKASLLLNASRFDETAQACRAALSRDPLCLEAYLILGMAARHQGEHDEALTRLREAIYLNPSCWPAHFYTAETLLAQKDEKRARSSYETVIRLLEKGPAGHLEQAFFPLQFNTDQFMLICRHKLSLLKKG